MLNLSENMNHIERKEFIHLKKNIINDVESNLIEFL